MVVKTLKAVFTSRSNSGHVAEWDVIFEVDSDGDIAACEYTEIKNSGRRERVRLSRIRSDDPELLNFGRRDGVAVLGVPKAMFDKLMDVQDVRILSVGGTNGSGEYNKAVVMEG